MGDLNPVVCCMPNEAAGSHQTTQVRCWRLLVPPSIAEIAATAVGAKLYLDHGQTIYNFGVFEGASMYTYRAFFPKAELLAFDSFEGLPEEKAGEGTTRIKPRQLIV